MHHLITYVAKSQRLDETKLACAARNVEAKEAGYDTVYKYDIVDSIKMFQESDHVTL